MTASLMTDGEYRVDSVKCVYHNVKYSEQTLKNVISDENVGLIPCPESGEFFKYLTILRRIL